MKSDEIPSKHIKKLGIYMTDDLEYAAFIDAETKEPVLWFPGRAFLSSAITLLMQLAEEKGQENLDKFLKGEKLQK